MELYPPDNSAGDLFGMVSSRDPFKWLSVTSNRVWKGHGLNHLTNVIHIHVTNPQKIRPTR